MAFVDKKETGFKTVIKGFLNGYFPMPGADGKVQWRSPERRCVIPIDGFHVPKNVKRLIRQNKFEIRVNTSFEDVIRACAERESPTTSFRSIANCTAEDLPIPSKPGRTVNWLAVCTARALAGSLRPKASSIEFAMPAKSPAWPHLKSSSPLDL